MDTTGACSVRLQADSSVLRKNRDKIHPSQNLNGARPVLRLLDNLEDLDDVQGVFANFDIPDEVFAEVS